LFDFLEVDTFIPYILLQSNYKNLETARETEKNDRKPYRLQQINDGTKHQGVSSLNSLV